MNFREVRGLADKVTPFVDFQHIEDVLVITQLKEVPADSDSAD